MRSTLRHVEAALEARESELHDMWQSVRQQAADLQLGARMPADLLQADDNTLVSPRTVPVASSCTCSKCIA